MTFPSHAQRQICGKNHDDGGDMGGGERDKRSRGRRFLTERRGGGIFDMSDPDPEDPSTAVLFVTNRSCTPRHCF